MRVCLWRGLREKEEGGDEVCDGSGTGKKRKRKKRKKRGKEKEGIEKITASSEFDSVNQRKE